MKRVEVRLSLEVVAPLLDVIKGVTDSLANRLGLKIDKRTMDEEMRETWEAELLGGQNEDVQRLLSLFDSEFFATGVVAFDAENAESVLRACAVVRLQLREQSLGHLDDAALEVGELGADDMDETMKRVFMCYVFLATMQEIIIKHLDGEILGD